MRMMDKVQNSRNRDFFMERTTRDSNHFNFFILLIRLSLGTLYVMAGVLLFLNYETFLHVFPDLELEGFLIDSYKEGIINILPRWLYMAYAYSLPFALVIAGGFYVLGFMTRLCSFILFFLTVTFILYNGFFPPSLDIISPISAPFNKDIIFAMISFGTLFSGAGRYSLDYIIRSI